MTVPLSDARLTEIREVYSQWGGYAIDADRVSKTFAAVRELLGEVDRLRDQVADLERTVTYFDAQSKRRKEERDQARAKVHAAETVQSWVSADGQRFVFVEDLAFALGSTASEAVCHCGHTEPQHQGADKLGGAQCVACPGDEERAWRHQFTTASAGSEADQ